MVYTIYALLNYITVYVVYIYKFYISVLLGATLSLRTGQNYVVFSVFMDKRLSLNLFFFLTVKLESPQQFNNFFIFSMI